MSLSQEKVLFTKAEIMSIWLRIHNVKPYTFLMHAGKRMRVPAPDQAVEEWRRRA